MNQNERFMRTYLRTYIYVYPSSLCEPYTYLHVYRSPCDYIYKCNIYIYIYMCVCVYVCMCTYVHTHWQAGRQADRQTDKQIAIYLHPGVCVCTLSVCVHVYMYTFYTYIQNTYLLITFSCIDRQLCCCRAALPSSKPSPSLPGTKNRTSARQEHSKFSQPKPSLLGDP